MPEQDAVVAITSETPDMQDELNMVWKFLLPAMKKKRMPANDSLTQVLNQQVASLVLPIPGNSNISSLAESISGKTFAMSPNERGIREMTFRFTDGLCNVTFKSDTSEHTIGFASGRWHKGETMKRGPYLVGTATANREGLPPFKVTGVHSWRDEQKLELVLRYIESPHKETMVCRFEGKNLQVDFRNSFSNKVDVLKGAANE
jgi:hypothetical protein